MGMVGCVVIFKKKMMAEREEEEEVMTYLPTYNHLILFVDLYKIASPHHTLNRFSDSAEHFPKQFHQSSINKFPFLRLDFKFPSPRSLAVVAKR